MKDEQREALAPLPWRVPEGDRPALPLPPGSMPLRFAGGWRKRWRYVSAFGERLMICAASVQVGPAGQTFWAVLDRESGELHERTRMRLPSARGEVWNENGEGRPLEIGMEEAGAIGRFESGEVRGKLTIGPGVWQEAICAAPDGERQRYTWTRKRVAPVEVDVRLPGERRIRETARGVEDESAGYHPRHTAWTWSAGVGVGADGREVGWNLVSGVNDPERGSERAIWVDGVNLGDPLKVADVLVTAGFDAAELQAQAAEPAVKDALKATTDEAIRRGVFGAPTCFVGNEMFFGQYRLDFVRAALKS